MIPTYCTIHNTEHMLLGWGRKAGSAAEWGILVLRSTHPNHLPTKISKYVVMKGRWIRTRFFSLDPALQVLLCLQDVLSILTTLTCYGNWTVLFGHSVIRSKYATQPYFRGFSGRDWIRIRRKIDRIFSIKFSFC